MKKFSPWIFVSLIGSVAGWAVGSFTGLVFAFAGGHSHGLTGLLFSMVLLTGAGMIVGANLAIVIAKKRLGSEFVLSPLLGHMIFGVVLPGFLFCSLCFFEFQWFGTH